MEIWNKVYSHWNKEKIFWKKVQERLKQTTFRQKLDKFWQTNRQTNRLKWKSFSISKIGFIVNFYNFIQCNTIVQLTNYSYIIIKNNACTFHKLWDNRRQRRNILRLEQPNKYFLFNSYNIAWELSWKYTELDPIVHKIKYSSSWIELNKYSK